MKNKVLAFLMVLILASFMTKFSYARDAAEEEVTPRSKKIYLEPEKSFYEKGKFKFLAALTTGYDDNTHLNSRRDGDVYFQTFFKGSWVTPLDNKTDGTLSYEMMNLLYTGESKLDLTRNGLHAGIDHELTKDLTISAGYNFDILDYINTRDDDFVENSLNFKLTHKLPYKMFHSLEYDMSYKNYTDFKVRNTDMVVTDKEREDFRNEVGYEIGKYFKNDMISINFHYFNNNSNDRYMNYYDYDSFKLGSSLTHIFNKKIFGYLSFSRQLRDYRSRTIVQDVNVKEWEKTYLMTSAMYYNLNKSVSFGLSYTYRQNCSNESLDRYSGSLISLSTYCKF